MGADNDRRPEELLGRLEALIDGAELDDLRQLAGDLELLGADPGRARVPHEPRDLRRPPLPDVRVFRVRADLKRSQPRIWRRLELRSDLTLDVVHRVLQMSFGWLDYHLWRFSVGGEPFGRSVQAFLCPWDVEDGEENDDGLPAASDIRLDEVMQDPGDVLFYVYDYGDSWELILKLEAVSDADPDAPAAALTDAPRAAPPEDCGGLVDGEELAELLEDPDRFDLEETDALLRSPYIALSKANVDRRVVQILDRLGHGPLDEELQRRAFAPVALTRPSGRGRSRLRGREAAFAEAGLRRRETRRRLRLRPRGGVGLNGARARRLDARSCPARRRWPPERFTLRSGARPRERAEQRGDRARAPGGRDRTGM